MRPEDHIMSPHPQCLIPPIYEDRCNAILMHERSSIMRHLLHILTMGPSAGLNLKMLRRSVIYNEAYTWPHILYASCMSLINCYLFCLGGDC